MNRPLAAALFFLSGISAALPAYAAEKGSILPVEIDHARIVEIDRPAATVIVGNPAIVDVEVLNSTRLVLTGRSYGITNLVILDENGQQVVDQQVAVQTFEDNTVRVYRQASRTTLACAPKCEPTVTIGDDVDRFTEATSQYSTRQSMARDAAQN